jgi:hypothetical protein
MADEETQEETEIETPAAEAETPEPETLEPAPVAEVP